MRKSPSQICASWLHEGIKCQSGTKQFAQAPGFVLAQAMRLSIHECAMSFLLGSVALLALCRELLADEGMWLFNAVPAERLQQRYQFTASPAWLEHLQKSSVRFGNGGSGSFVSADGLVITNHHVGIDSLQKLSDASHTYARDGFYAATRTEEKRCLDLELRVLMSIEDVTARVNAAVRPEMNPEQAYLARRKVIAEIEQESQDKSGLQSHVVTLYMGAEATSSTGPNDIPMCASYSLRRRNPPFMAAIRITSSIHATVSISACSGYTRTVNRPMSRTT
jgi:hypothetical protein